MRFEVLGPVRFRRGDDWVTPAGTLQANLLGLLLAQGGRPVPVDLLVDQLWPSDHDPRTTSRLQVQVHRLRQRLGDDRIVLLEPGGYALSTQGGELDADRFEELARQALDPSTPPHAVVELADAARALWRGTSAYAGLTAPGCEDEARRLGEVHRTLLEAGYAARLDIGDSTSVLDELALRTREEPLHEGFHVMHVTALALAGRRSDALAACRRVRQVLADELGVEPGPELRSLHQRLLAGEDPRPRSAPRPAQLPAPPRDLTGRDEDLAALDELATPRAEGPVTVVISGTAGVGKTALALAWAHRASGDFPDGQLFCDLRGFSPDPPREPTQVLARFGRALGVPGVDEVTDPDELAALFRSALAGRRMLVVLDNAGSVGQVRPLLPSSAGCLTVVTSRLSLGGLVARDGAATLPLGPLDPAASLALARSVVGPAVDDEPGWASLLDRCAHLPLAIRIAAGNLAAQHGPDLAGLIGRLPNRRDQLDVLTTGDDPDSDVRSVISWSYNVLEPQPAAVFRAFGVVPTQVLDTVSVSVLTGLDERSSGLALTELVRANMVEEPRPGWFGQHDLLSAFAVERSLDDSPEDRAEARSRLLLHHASGAASAMREVDPGRPLLGVGDGGTPPVRIDGAEEGMSWLEDRLPVILAAVGVADPLKDAGALRALSVLVGRFLNRRGSDQLGLPLHRAALSAAVVLGDRGLEVSARRMLGTALAVGRQHEDAVRELVDALESARSLPAPREVAPILNALAVIAAHHGRSEEAHQHLVESVRWAERVDDAHQLAVSLANLGEVLVDLGRPGEALDWARRSQQVAEQAGNPQGVAESLHVLAVAHQALLDTDSAESYAMASLRVAREAADRRSQIGALRDIGYLRLGRGDHEAALCSFREGLELSRQTANAGGTAELMEACGRALRAGVSPDALSYFEEALDLARRSGARHKEAELQRDLDEARSVLR